MQQELQRVYAFLWTPYSSVYSPAEYTTLNN
jgi:hypothetical protein